MERPERGWVGFALLTTAVIVSVSPGSAWQADQRLTISVHDPRPLAEAIRTLEKRHGWIVTYEDPVYVHSDDIADVTVSVRKDYTPDKPKVLVPRGGTFEFGYTIPAGAREPDAPAVLQQLVNEYNGSGPTGKFRLVRTGNVFHVVPSHFKDAAANAEPGGSVLDMKISVAVLDRSLYEMFQVIVTAVSDRTGGKVGVGTFPINLFLQRRVQDGAGNETARTVLVRMLESTHRKLSWKLYCGTGAIRTCALNIVSVPGS